MYHGGARVTPMSSTFWLDYDGIGHYIFAGDTTTNGAPHAYPNSAKG
jgi:hypothetical protein